MIRGVFIAGTDTGVGKTVVAAGLLSCARARGIDLVPMKPVETGVDPRRSGACATDLGYATEAAGKMPAGTAEKMPAEGELELMGPYRYEPACSPHLAGRMAGRYPDIGHIVACAARLSGAHDAILVEGAGGVLVPLDESRTMLDLMKALALPVVLVARRGLGTINHTLLSLAALRGAGLRVLGVVLNETRERKADFVDRDNPKAIATFGEAPILGNVNFRREIARGCGPGEAWDWFEREAPGLAEVLREVRPS